MWSPASRYASFLHNLLSFRVCRQSHPGAKRLTYRTKHGVQVQARDFVGTEHRAQSCTDEGEDLGEEEEYAIVHARLLSLQLVAVEAGGGT